MSDKGLPSGWLEAGPYSWPQPAKTQALLPRLAALTRWHYERCATYRNVVDNVFGGLKPQGYASLAELPFLPVSLFKQFELRSVGEESVLRTLSSSGTSGSAVSRIYLDRPTATNQSAVLVKILQHFLGRDRMPMVIVDHPDVIKDRQAFSARGAGIVGLLQFGRKPLYALRSDMSLDVPQLKAYLAEHAGQRVLFFGFTFMVWKHLLQALERSGDKLEVEHGVLIHSGGWKKLEAEQVGREEFGERAQRCCGIRRVLNFYGMAEQVGSVFLENSLHHLHAPIYSDVLIRDPFTLEVQPPRTEGLIQLFSVLPESYPGHSILTEDLGCLMGEDDPQLEMKGRFFRVTGRVPQSDLRGCSDTYAADHAA